MRLLALGASSLLIGSAFALPVPDLSGKWIPDSSIHPLRFNEKGMWIEFRKGGTFTFRGFNVSGAGTYRIQGDRLFFALTRRGGGRPSHPRENNVEAKIVENGRSILLPTGEIENGKVVLTRLVRAKR